MKSIKELEPICDLIHKYGLPKEHIIFETESNSNDTNLLFKSFGTSAIIEFNYKQTDLNVQKVEYGLCTFYFVNTGYKVE